MEIKICAHCLSEIKPSEEVYDEISGKGLVFCCVGCNAIYRLIHEAGLEKFYERRVGWKSGRPEIIEVDPAEFSDFVKRRSENELELEFLISGLRCASCIWLIEHLLKKLDGVIEVRINYATHRATLRWQEDKVSLAEILKKISSLGYNPRPVLALETEEELKREKMDLLIRFGTASFFTMQLMLYTVALYSGYFQGIEEGLRRLFQWIALSLTTPVVFYSGYPFLKNALRGLRNRALNMDVLIFLGSFSAYAYSIAIIFLTTTPILPWEIVRVETEVYFDTSAMIITFVLLGRFLETTAKYKASSSLSGLFFLQPRRARVWQKGEEVWLRLEELSRDDLVVVKPGERIPVDGVVVEGQSEVDEKMLTGESIPVLKGISSKVFAGTLNLNGLLVIKTEEMKDTLLQRITQAVLEAQMRRPKLQTVADRVVGYFVPTIILLSLLTFLYWYLHTSLTEALMNAVSVLVIACPCALGLATPLAILISSGAFFSLGIIIKDGRILEEVVKASVLCFDKTGTLTEGNPTLLKVVPYGCSKVELHRWAASLEKASEHVVARAIVEAYEGKDFFEVKDFQAIAGMGAKGLILGVEVMIGNLRFLEASEVEILEQQRQDYEEYDQRGYTVVGLAVGKKLKGWFIISDRINPTAKEVIAFFKERGKKIVLLTGDQRKVAQEVAKNLNIERFYAEVLPLEKAEIVKSLKVETLKGKTGKGGVIMVGDGINDAPALSVADVGIATGGAADVAAECAGTVLMRKDLNLLLKLYEVSNRTLIIIKQNLFWAFSYNFITLPLAMLGKIHPMISAILMAFSSLLVVSNSLRLRRIRT